MTSYEDVAGPRRAKLSAKGRRQLRQFEQAATLAVQVMELRAKPGSTALSLDSGVSGVLE